MFDVRIIQTESTWKSKVNVGAVEGGGLITLHFPRNPAPSTFGLGRYFVSLSHPSLDYFSI